ncbi:unnamed protein product [Cylicostephanus goldi]|uniref:Uncharacterized protein n=1 Tax=Cylicostephanus goldi TaxID=71465 RepID=A0A3P7ML77_CYLGO|nr:unnamed protein product [Cylicostephanus goldi]
MLPYTLISHAILLSCVAAYKLVIFVPCVAKSQVVFNIRVADTLSKAGHEVTMVMLQVLDEDDTKIVKVPSQIQTYYLNGSSGVKMKDFEEEQQEFIYQLRKEGVAGQSNTYKKPEINIKDFHCQEEF